MITFIKDLFSSVVNTIKSLWNSAVSIFKTDDTPKEEVKPTYTDTCIQSVNLNKDLTSVLVDTFIAIEKLHALTVKRIESGNDIERACRLGITKRYCAATNMAISATLSLETVSKFHMAKLIACVDWLLQLTRVERNGPRNAKNSYSKMPFLDQLGNEFELLINAQMKLSGSLELAKGERDACIEVSHLLDVNGIARDKDIEELINELG